jgi:hypothetical protein
VDAKMSGVVSTLILQFYFQDGKRAQFYFASLEACFISRMERGLNFTSRVSKPACLYP